MTSLTLRVPRNIYQDIVDHARRTAPAECVGVLLGSCDGQVRLCCELVNELSSPTRFRSEPRSLFAVEKYRRSLGLEYLAVYHSHPATPPIPSQADIAEHWGGRVLCVIVSLISNPPTVAGWWLHQGKALPARLEIDGQPTCMPLAEELDANLREVETK
jgi:proteasome lid subunit RPN8/RPN11